MVSESRVTWVTCVPIVHFFSDPEKRDARGQFFRRYARTVWSRTTKSGTIIHVVEAHLLGVSHALILRGGARASPPPKKKYCAHVVWETVTKFCTAIKLDEWQIFTGSTTPPTLAIFFWHECYRAVCLRYLTPLLYLQTRTDKQTQMTEEKTQKDTHQVSLSAIITEVLVVVRVVKDTFLKYLNTKYF